MSMNVEEKHLQTLSKHKHIYDLFEKTGEVVNFHQDIRREIVDAYKVHNPYFHYNDNCQACVTEMLSIIYRWYKQVTNKTK